MKLVASDVGRFERAQPGPPSSSSASRAFRASVRAEPVFASSHVGAFMGRGGGRDFIRSRIASSLYVAVSDLDLSPLSITLGDDKTIEVKQGQLWCQAPKDANLTVLAPGASNAASQQSSSPSTISSRMWGPTARRYSWGVSMNRRKHPAPTPRRSPSTAGAKSASKTCTNFSWSDP